MKIVFCSNYLNHHQLSLCFEILNKQDVEYFFIATIPIEKDRLSMGYKNMNDLYPWVIKTYQSESEKKRALKLIDQADVVIIGSAPDYLIKERLKNNKLTFRYSERLYKKGVLFRFKPRAIVGQFIHHTRFRRKNLYMLCASAYTSYDFSLWGNYKNKCFKWGYFPVIEKKELSYLLNEKSNERISILWAGRMLKLKHPEYVLFLAEYLKDHKRNFHITVIGDGEMKKSILLSAEKMHVENYIDFLHFMPPHEVRAHMEKSDIFLFTSDFNEGWGAVLNESMGSACAVVASHACGSVPFLIKDFENGMIYRYGNVEEFCEKVDQLVVNPELRNKLQRNAYSTIFDEWSATNAANQFINLSKTLLNGKKEFRNSGVCSVAEIIKNNWKKE